MQRLKLAQDKKMFLLKKKKSNEHGDALNEYLEHLEQLTALLGRNLFHRVNYFHVKLHNELIPLITKNCILLRADTFQV
jgi:hypothetical protein